MASQGLALLLLPLLFGCNPHTPETLDFTTDPRILRGAYVGTLDDRFLDPSAANATNRSTGIATLANRDRYTVTLEATPEYVSQEVYRVTGRLRIDEIPPRAFELEGTVQGEDHQRYIRPQVRPPIPATLTAMLRDGEEAWALELYQWRETSWQGSLETSTGRMFWLELHPGR